MIRTPILSTLLVAAACSGLLLGTGGCSDDSGGICTPGVTQSCACPGGKSGVMTCTASGSGWSTCQCKSISDGGKDGAARDKGQGKEGGAPGDGKVTDGATPDKTTKDLGPADASVAKFPWTKMPTPSGSSTLYDIWGTGAKNIYAVGQKGLILHFTGRKPETGPWWNQATSTTPSSLHGVWGSSRFDVFALGEKGTIVRSNGSQWSALTSPFTRTFRAVHGGGYTAVYAMGEFGNLALNDRATDPNTWTPVKTGYQETFLGGWGKGKNIIIAGSNGTLLRYDGTSWKKMTSPTTDHLWDIWGSGDKNIFAVGENGTIIRYDGTSWKKMTSPVTTQLFGVWGSGPTDVWAVGDYGEAVHFNGASWSKKLTGVKVGLRAVWGTGPNNVYAVGEQSTILHYAPCACKVGASCYQSGDVDATGCKTCDPKKSTTALSPKVGACTIGGKCYAKGEYDSAWCNKCDPLKSTTAWTAVTNVCSINGACYGAGQFGPSSCQVCTPAKNKTGWSGAGGWCTIGGKCYAKGAKDGSGCQECNPVKSSSSWSPLSGMCNINGKCYKNGVKDTAYACRSCNTAKNTKAWTVDAGKCLVGGKCLASGTKDSSGCQLCNPAKTQIAWSAVAGKCFIGGKCYAAGVGDGSGCRSCAPAKNDKAWTVAGTKCFIGGKCYNNNTFPSNQCQKCDVSKSQTAWTIVTNKCWIANNCYNSGQTSPGGCDICDPAKNPSGWTTVGCTAYPLPKKKITFAAGTSSSSMTMYTIDSDGSNLAKVPGFGTLYTNQYTYLYGRPRQYYTFTSDVPQVGYKYSYYPVILPYDKGTVRWYRDTTANQVGLLHFKADGTPTKLYSTSGSSTSYFYSYVAVSDNGDYVAGVSSTYKRLILMRTDGKTFPNGKPHVEWTLNPAYYLTTNSITITDKAVFVVTRPTSSSYQYNLWWAPTTGSQAPQRVNFPTPGGINPYYIYPYMTGSRDGSKLVLNIGPSTSSSSSRDIIAVDAATGKATRITKSSGYYYYPGTQWGYSTSSHYVDVSPKGSYVAYVRYSNSSTYDLFVAKADGTGSEIHVGSSANFNGAYRRFYSLRWATDDILTFTAYGSSSSYIDVFTYQVSTATLRNASGQQDNTKPYSLNSQTYHRIYGMWFSPNRKYLYYISYKTSPTTLRDIKGVELTTGKKIDVTTGAEVYSNNDAFATCGKGSKMFFAAEPKYSSYNYLQVFMFDMNNPAKALQLTNLSNPQSTTYNYIYDMTANSDCSFVSFRSGYSYYNAFSIHATTPPMVGQMTNYSSTTGAGYVYDYMAYAQNKSQIVYFAGPASNKYEMYVAPPAMGSCCSPKKVWSGPAGTYKYWMLYGVQ